MAEESKVELTRIESGIEDEAIEITEQEALLYHHGLWPASQDSEKKIYEIFLKISENFWKSVKKFENLWKNLKICENFWKSVKIFENLWKFFENLWKFLKIYEHFWKSVKNVENLWKFLKILKIHYMCFRSRK